MGSIRADFNRKFDRCFLCGARTNETFPPRLETHEITRGPSRAKSLQVRAALIRTCPPCHAGRLDGMSVVRQLAIKKFADPEGYDRLEVNRLRRRAPESITEAEVNYHFDDMLNTTSLVGTGFPFTRLR
jgi:hypothetical protein